MSLPLPFPYPPMEAESAGDDKTPGVVQYASQRPSKGNLISLLGRSSAGPEEISGVDVI